MWITLSNGLIFVLLTLIRWIAIYPVDSVIQPLNNRGQENTEDVLAGKINKMTAMENILEEVFVRRFFMEENNSY